MCSSFVVEVFGLFYVFISVGIKVKNELSLRHQPIPDSNVLCLMFSTSNQQNYQAIKALRLSSQRSMFYIPEKPLSNWDLQEATVALAGATSWRSLQLANQWDFVGLSGDRSQR